MSDDVIERFSVFAETEDFDDPLIMTNLTFARLMDDVIVPYESGEAFFIDGVPVKREKLRRLKIIRQSPFFDKLFNDLHYGMRHSGPLKIRELYADQYQVRLEALLREGGEDVTSQIIKAFDKIIRPSLKDYLPRRDELISAALKVFIEGIKALGGL